MKGGDPVFHCHIRGVPGTWVVTATDLGVT
jgi:hypothetical protein